MRLKIQYYDVNNNDYEIFKETQLKHENNKQTKYTMIVTTQLSLVS